MKDSWVVVTLKNGSVYSVALSMLEKVKEYANRNTDIMVPFLCASDSGMIYIRPSHISSYHVSTPEIREKDKEWEDFINEVKPWEDR